MSAVGGAWEGWVNCLQNSSPQPPVNLILLFMLYLSGCLYMLVLSILPVSIHEMDVFNLRLSLD